MGHNKQDNNKDLDGKVLYISATKYVNEKLSTRTLVLEVFDGDRSLPCPFIFKNNRMDCLNGVKDGEWVNVQYKMGGFKGKQEGEPRYYAENIGITVIKG